ncbi:MAG: FecR domain-containing protein [Rhizobiaceae bacterium]
MNRIIPALLIAAAATAGCATGAAAEGVGTMTAFQTVIKRLNGPALGVGAEIFLNDRLRSNNTGLGMIVFLDESSAKIGPNSSLTIDEFVYDPGTRRGSSTIRADSGLTRFYGGQISKRGRMNVRTPHMVLGVRGGIADISVKRSASEGILRAGQLTCRLGRIKKIITKPGFSCISNGSTIDVGPAGRSRHAVLDSTDRIAGTGVPGDRGSGIDGHAGCASKAGTFLKRCRSRDGSIPRAELPREPNFPGIPLGRQ